MKYKINLALSLIFVLFALNLKLSGQDLLPPPQDKGLPYTRSGRQLAEARIKNCIAVFAGSRYAWVQGYKVRLDDVHWHLEAVSHEGALYVPEAFTGLIDTKKIETDIAPSYLIDKWVYTAKRNAFALDNIRSIRIDGQNYVAFTDVAKARGLKVYENKNGLAIAGTVPVSFNENEKTVLQSVITLFDSPEKLADPDIATQYIPSLQRQGKWTDHVRVSPEQIKILEGPETKWTETAQVKFDLTGFNTQLLGSKVPPPGVYPRILFSPEDVPMLAKRIMSSKMGQKSMIEVKYLLNSSWWNPKTSDGMLFQKLASGDLKGLEWPEIDDGKMLTDIPQLFIGEKPGIYSSHVAYVPECLTDMALYCLLINDNEHGRQAAAAIANYFKLREPLIDEWNSISDSEFGTGYIRANGKRSELNGSGSNTNWRNIHGIVAQMDLGLALDFAGKWMTPNEKDLMRRVIAKATYGRRGYGQDGPVRFRDVNWVTWDLPNFLALAAIEGLEGFDQEAYESDCETIRAFCEWGIDDSGVIYESNGKTPGGMQFHTLSMIALARRGENLWGHPHIRRLLQAQVQMTSPSGRVIVNSGTQYVPYSRSNFSLQTTDEYKAFYPGNHCADYILSQSKDENLDNFDAEQYKKSVEKVQRLRLPSPMYPGLVLNSLLYDTDFKQTSRAELNLPLDFNAPIHGVFSSYSDTTRNAAWMNMMVRPDHYIGAGHHHADAGMFHFSALGVDWFTESPFCQVYDGRFHNQVLVDSISEPQGINCLGLAYQAPAKYLGAVINPEGSFASADLTNSYSYRWFTQPPQVWSEMLKSIPWELDPSPENLKTFAGTTHYKMRPWWSTYTYSNYMPTVRAPFNTMKYVYRTVGLIRGNHPYGIIMDDLKKDENPHLYQWTAMLNGGVWIADVKGLKPGQVVLAYRNIDGPANNAAPVKPSKNDPLLLVCVLQPDGSMDPSLSFIQVSTEKGVKDRIAKTEVYDRLAINTKSAEVNYRILFVPFHYGESMPKIYFDHGKVNVEWKGQRDYITFKNIDKRTLVSVSRKGKTIAESK